MKSILIAGFVVASLAVAGSANASPELAKSSGCTKCHDVDKKKVGPAFKDVAAKHKGKAGADVALVAKLKGGKEHPAVKASEGDAKKLVAWILQM